MSHPITHNAAHSRFETAPQGWLATCEYRLQGQVMVLHHTEVPSQLQGQGVAADLVRVALEHARAQGLRVRPTCSYVASYMRRHPQTQDLLEGSGSAA
jgi:predicted GNAT family acetyltransferase